MKKKLQFSILISIIAVLFLAAAVSSSEDITPPQISIISPDNGSIITDYLVSETIVPPSEFWKVETDEDKLDITLSATETSQP